MGITEYEELVDDKLTDEVSVQYAYDFAYVYLNKPGPCDEFGDVLEAAQKLIGTGHGFQRDNLISELADALWLIAAVASKAGLRLNDIVEASSKKLQEKQ